MMCEPHGQESCVMCLTPSNCRSAVVIPPHDLSEEIKQDRLDKGYGEHHNGSKALGRAWAAILSDHYGHSVADIPASVVCLMLVALKVGRMARPNINADAVRDSQLDGTNYLRFAEESRAKERE